MERVKRHDAVTKQRRAAKAQQHEQFLEAGEKRRQAEADRQANQAQRFVDRARAMLPRETFLAIWEAVNASPKTTADDQEPPHG